MEGFFGDGVGFEGACLYVAGDGCGGVCDFGTSAVVDAHGEGADGVVTGFAFALFELFDDVFPEFGAAACPADAYSPGFEGFELPVEDFGGETHDEGYFAG